MWHPSERSGERQFSTPLLLTKLREDTSHDTYPENVVFRGSGHGLLHSLVQLFLSSKIPRDGSPDLRPDVMQCAQASLESRGTREDPGPFH